MAIIEHFIPRKDMKDMGNVQIIKRWGKYVLRTKPYDPKTPAEQANRMRFKKLALLVHQVKDCIDLAYAGLIHSVGHCAYNCVLGINMKHCFVNNTSTINPRLFVLCDNDGSFVTDVVLSSTVENTITGTFNSNTQNADENADPVKAYGFYADGNQIWQFDQSATRSSGTIILIKPEISRLAIAVYFECLDRINLINGNPKHIIKYVGILTVL